MITAQQPVEEGQFLRTLRRHDAQGLQGAELTFDWRWRRPPVDRQRTWAPRAAVIRRPLAGWQADQAFLLQFQKRFRGTCYRAANWLWLGQTQGRGRNDRFHQLRVPIKDIYVRSLCEDFRQRLTQSRTPELTPEACGPCHRLVA